MKILKSLVVLACLLPAIGLADDDGGCKQIKEAGVTVPVTANCPSPIHLCAAGAVTGDELISGTTFASVLGLAPSIGLPGIEPATSVSLAGERTNTTSDGTLMFRFITVFDTARGEFAEIDRVTGGTGRFEGATGTLWFTGTATTTTFPFKIRGQICTKRL